MVEHSVKLGLFERVKEWLWDGNHRALVNNKNRTPQQDELLATWDRTRGRGRGRN